MVHANIKILRWFNFFTDFKLYSPIAIIYFAQVTDFYALGMSIFSDRIGRRQTMIVGAAAAVF